MQDSFDEVSLQMEPKIENSRKNFSQMDPDIEWANFSQSFDNIEAQKKSCPDPCQGDIQVWEDHRSPRQMMDFNLLDDPSQKSLSYQSEE